jgi:hypothetical protein
MDVGLYRGIRKMSRKRPLIFLDLEANWGGSYARVGAPSRTVVVTL